MLSRLFCVAIAVIACVSAATPGVPTILQVPLNTTLYPNGFTGTTTNATSYQIVPIDQVAFMVPTNALSVRIQIDSPDQTNSWWAYDISTVGPLCLLSGERYKTGYTCGGLTTSADHRTDASYNFTFDASGASEDSSGFRWATGTYFFFGFTSDTSFSASPIPYILRSITIETCPAGFIGGYYASATVCIPLQTIGSSTNTTFSYVGGSTGLTLELTVPAMTGAMVVTFTVPKASIGTLSYDPDVRGASMGFPSSYNAQCSSESTTTGEVDIVTTFTCPTPASGRYYVHFDADTTANFTGTVAVAYTICNASRAGEFCEDNLINLGNVTTANNSTSFTFAIPAGNSTQYKLTVPAGTNYGFNITFSQDDSDYTYANINNYASDDAYPNSNWYSSATGNTPFVFQPQQNVLGHVVYFHIPSDSDATTVNITITTTGAVIPTSTSRTVSTSSTQTQTGTTTDARSNSSILIASIAMTLLALVF